MSLERLHEHRRIWQEKPDLSRIYADWFGMLLERAPRGGRVLEIGAGPGFMAEHAKAARPDLAWVATDLIPAPWNTVAADALRLPFRDGSFDLVTGIDVVHHLALPLPFFAEAARVLRRGASVAVVEPWVTVLSYPIYRFLHQEGCTLDLDPEEPFAHAGGTAKEAFIGDAASVYRLVKDLPEGRWRALGLLAPLVKRINTFGYLLSLGFRRRSLLAPGVLPLARGADRLTQPLSSVLAMRALVEWERA